MVRFHGLMQILRVILPMLTAVCFCGLACGVFAGPLYRIGVDSTGIVQITPRQLAMMGFDDPGRVAVYGYGGAAGWRSGLSVASLEDLPEVPSMVTDDGRILFYGQGPESVEGYTLTGRYLYVRPVCNTADAKGYYFVGARTDPSRPVSLPVSDAGRVHTTHWSYCVYHPMTTNPARAGAFFLGEDFSGSAERMIAIAFPTPDLPESGLMSARAVGAVKAENPVFRISFGGAAGTLRAISTRNGYSDSETYFAATDKYEISSVTPADRPASVTFKADLSVAGRVGYAAFETVAFAYTRLNLMPGDGTGLSMLLRDTSPGDVLAIENAAGTIVWDVTRPDVPRQLGCVADGTSLTVSLQGTDNGVSHLVAFKPSHDQPSVSLEGPVTANGRLSSMSVPDMVILTAPALRAEADRLASVHRRYQGMDVAVVEPREVFDEFGSGCRSPYAVRRFMKSLYDRSGSAPFSLLIMGASTFDPAGHISGEPVDDTHVLTYEVENLFKQGYASTCYCTDAFYGFLDDDLLPDDVVSARMSINVGRIPAVTRAQAVAYIDKVERYLMSPPGVDVRSRALVVCDYGDNNGHLKQGVELSDSIVGRWAPATIVVKGISGLYQRATGNRRPLLTKVSETLADGVGYMVYAGHGNPGAIGSDRFMKRADVLALDNTHCPLVMLATCYSLGFDRSEDGVAEQFLFNPGGGALALVGSGRAVQMSYNHHLSMKMAREYFTLSSSSMMGDVYRVARNMTVGLGNNSEVTVNTACFNYVGDPALPLYPYTHDIRMELPEDFGVTPLSVNTVSGCIVDGNGDLSTGFNGRVTIRLYEPERVDKSRYDPSKDAVPMDVTRRETLVSFVEGRIENGRFEIQLHCPEVVKPGDGYVMTVHALSDDASQRALAMSGGITVAGLPDNPGIDTSVPPGIDGMWINSRRFADGDIVGPAVNVCGRIIPSPSGLSLTKTIGRTISLSVDGTCYGDVVSYMTMDDDGVYNIDYPLSGLSDGAHTAVLTVFDNAGNKSSHAVNFTVVTTVNDVIIESDSKTATTEATFSLRHNLAYDLSGRIVIENETGEAVFSRSGVTFPYTWNLDDNEGDPVPDGCYTVRAWLRGGLQYVVTQPLDFTVVRMPGITLTTGKQLTSPECINNEN